MSSLAEYIKSRPARPLHEWAAEFGVSRPMLYSLMDGTRHPSIRTAKRIAAATDGAVPVRAWPNLAAVLDAAGDRGAA